MRKIETNQKINLREIERKAFVSYHRDGLIDLFLGFMMLVAILSSTLDASGVADSIRIAIYIPIMVIFGPGMYSLGKKYITVPRLGYVKFGPIRRNKRNMVILGLVHIVLLTLVIWTASVGEKLGPLGAFMGPYGMTVVIVIIIMGFFSFAAFLTDYNRMYLLGMIVATMEPLHILAEQNVDEKLVGLISYGIPEIILWIMGTVVLSNLLKKFPRPAEDELQIANHAI